ncbi:MAG: tetratricopeptide repeat protein [Bacteroidota bacterium]
MKRTIVLTCFVLFPLFSQNDELTSIFDDANKLYLEQKYPAAISKYESIIKNGYENGEIYFNLGNAYYKSGKIQNAILNYERAKRFLPNDEDVQFNLALANAHLIDKVEAIPELFVYEWAEYVLTIVSLETMITIMYILFILTLVSFSLFLFARTYEQKRYSLLTGMVLAFFLVIGVVNFTIQSYRESNTEFAIVMTDVANIKSAPDKSGNDLFVIHRGLKVQVLDSVNKWRKIRLVDGKVGWIPEQEIETI